MKLRLRIVLDFFNKHVILILLSIDVALPLHAWWHVVEVKLLWSQVVVRSRIGIVVHIGVACNMRGQEKLIVLLLLLLLRRIIAAVYMVRINSWPQRGPDSVSHRTIILGRRELDVLLSCSTSSSWCHLADGVSHICLRCLLRIFLIDDAVLEFDHLLRHSVHLFACIFNFLKAACHFLLLNNMTSST